MFRFFSLRLGWLFAAGAVAVPVQRATAEITREFNETYRVGSEHRLVIDATQAEVSITGSDRDDISLHMVWNARTNDSDKAEERFARLQFTAEENGDATVLKLRAKRQGWFNWGNKQVPEVQVELQVPARLRLNVDLTSGEVVIRGVAGHHTVDTVSADVRMEDCAGDLHADSTSGKVTLLGCPGNHRTETISGDIRVEGGQGDVVADSTSGSIRILDFPGAHRADTISGDIHATLGSVLNENLRFESTSGNVVILVPAALAAQFELDTVSGDLRFEVPGAEIERAQKRELSARMGRGEPRVRLDTISGNITVRLDRERS